MVAEGTAAVVVAVRMAEAVAGASTAAVVAVVSTATAAVGTSAAAEHPAAEALAATIIRVRPIISLPGQTVRSLIIQMPVGPRTRLIPDRAPVPRIRMRVPASPISGALAAEQTRIIRFAAV